MSVLENIHIRKMNSEDKTKLEQWRKNYSPADLELPHGYERPGVETAVAEYGGELLASLTLSMAAVFNPLVKSPDAEKHGASTITAIIMLERALAHLASRQNIVTGYITVPNNLKDYQAIVERAGYERVLENCSIFRRHLVHPTEPSIGDERDKQGIPAI